jgi:hypothetical protein
VSGSVFAASSMVSRPSTLSRSVTPAATTVTPLIMGAVGVNVTVPVGSVPSARS